MGSARDPDPGITIYIAREKKKGVDARKRGGRELQNKHLVLFVFMLVP